MNRNRIFNKWAAGIVILFFALLWYHASIMAKTTEKEAFRYLRTVDGIQEYELAANGLKVLLMEDHSAPVATVMVTYLVGSRHETGEFRGGAHLLEHMMFKGTPTYNKARGTTIAAILQKTGAILNASTWKDGTNYFETLPSDKLEQALEIEADRMRNSLMLEQDLKFEMPVVQSEFDRMENSPLAALDNAVWGTAFEKHVYHFPIIGIRKDIEKMPIQSLKKFYDTYYWPDNAVLALIGDFDKDKMIDFVHQKFSKIPRSQAAKPQPEIEEPLQTQTKRVSIEREDQIEAMDIAFKVPPARHPDTITLDVLSFILSRGKTSRLYRTLVDQGLAVDVFLDHAKSHDPGLFTTEVLLTPQARHEDIERIVLAIYDQLKTEGVSEPELIRAKNQLHAEVAYSRDGSYSMADQLSRAIAAGDWTLFSEYLNKLEKVTAEDIRRAAQTYLRQESMTVGILRSKRPAVPYGKRPKADESILNSLKTFSANDAASATERSVPAKKSKPEIPKKLSERIHVKMIDGIKAMSIHTETKDVVTLVGSFEGAGQVYAENPLIPMLTVSLLDEGTLKKNKFEIATLLENRGAKISFQIDHRRVGFHAQCLKADMDLVIALIAEQLLEPTFDSEEFKKQVEQHKVQLHYSMNDTAARAQSALSRLIYPVSHPLHEPPYEEQLRLLDEVTIEKIKAFHQAHYGRQKMTFAASGDVDHEAFQKSVKTHLPGWRKEPAIQNFTKSITTSAETARLVIPMPDKVKVDVTFGHGIAITRKHPDYLALYLANAVLGGDFSSRLSSIVRDDLGLTYHIHSELHGFEQDLEGDWEISIILNNRLLEKGIQATGHELERFVRDGITEQELADEKNTIAGKFKVSLSTTGGIARQIVRNEELGFDLEYLDRYPDLIQQISLQAANQTIRTYFSTTHLHRVTAGTVDEPAGKNSSL